ncbi:MAG: hypothetical protein OHK0039_34450 [Bacteroidia bacterium]
MHMTVLPSTDQVRRLEESLTLVNLFFRRHRDAVERRYQISAQELDLIQFVVQNGPQKMKDVSEHFQLKFSTLTSIIDKAERRKLLKRSNSRDDRRVVLLEVTRKGRAIYDAYDDYLQQAVQLMQSRLPQEQFEQFVQGVEVFTRMALN